MLAAAALAALAALVAAPAALVALAVGAGAVALLVGVPLALCRAWLALARRPPLGVVDAGRAATAELTDRAP